MRFSDLVQTSSCIEPKHLESAQAIEVSAITADSREVKSGSLFFAVLGAKFDAKVFINEAFANGACAVIYNGTLDFKPNGFVLAVKDVRRALSYAASRFYGEPSLKLRNIAITGTSGKTSVAWLLSHSLHLLKSPTFLGGTLGFTLLKDGEDPAASLKELTNTTLDPISVHRLLADAVSQGAQSSVFEATSQGVIHSRMRDVAWDGAIFTNLTREHMDLHGSMEKYEAAKRELFMTDLAASSKKNRFAIFNFDDAAAKRVGCELKISEPDIEVISISLHSSPEIAFSITNLEATTAGLSFILSGRAQQVAISSRMVGSHNAYNLACAAIALLKMGYNPAQISRVLAEVPFVPGRTEPVPNKYVPIFVDYSHKADALEKVLRFLKPLCKGRLISVFGCGGDRDTGKRPIMGEISSRIADVTIVTSDNPRTEEPEEIVKQIVAGIENHDPKRLIIEIDRRKAIHLAVKMAHADDIILLAGKGHEPYQDIKGVKHPFHDIHVAKDALAACEERPL